MDETTRDISRAREISFVKENKSTENWIPAVKNLWVTTALVFCIEPQLVRGHVSLLVVNQTMLEITAADRITMDWHLVARNVPGMTIATEVLPCRKQTVRN